jgi:hypothetical protein
MSETEHLRWREKIAFKKAVRADFRTVNIAHSGEDALDSAEA